MGELPGPLLGPEPLQPAALRGPVGLIGTGLAPPSPQRCPGAPRGRPRRPSVRGSRSLFRSGARPGRSPRAAAGLRHPCVRPAGACGGASHPRPVPPDRGQGACERGLIVPGPCVQRGAAQEHRPSRPHGHIVGPAAGLTPVHPDRHCWIPPTLSRVCRPLFYNSFVPLICSLNSHPSTFAARRHITIRGRKISKYSITCEIFVSMVSSSVMVCA